MEIRESETRLTKNGDISSIGYRGIIRPPRPGEPNQQHFLNSPNTLSSENIRPNEFSQPSHPNNQLDGASQWEKVEEGGEVFIENERQKYHSVMSQRRAQRYGEIIGVQLPRPRES